jgi:hypothetical protein
MSDLRKFVALLTGQSNKDIWGVSNIYLLQSGKGGQSEKQLLLILCKDIFALSLRVFTGQIVNFPWVNRSNSSISRRLIQIFSG